MQDLPIESVLNIKSAPLSPPLLELRDLTIHFVVRRNMIGPDTVVHAADKVNLYLYRGGDSWIGGRKRVGKNHRRTGRRQVN